jgi:hypothetical protein
VFGASGSQRGQVVEDVLRRHEAAKGMMIVHRLAKVSLYTNKIVSFSEVLSQNVGKKTYFCNT